MINENELVDDNQPSANTEISDHGYCFDPTRLTLYVQNTLEYIAGFVVRKLTHRLNCELCIEALIEVEDNSSMTLIKFKNKGGLTNPSKDVMELCKIGEKEFRRMEIINTKQQLINNTNFLRIIISSQRITINKNLIANMLNHDDHSALIQKCILEEYS